MKRRNMLTGMMEVNIPIFYKSKQDRKVAETKADIQVAEAQYRAMKNEVLFMITDMASMIHRVERQLELYKTGIIPQASLQINSAMSAYRVNKADFMTLLDSQMTLYKYELEYHQALTEYEKSVASLGAVIGKSSLKRGKKNEKMDLSCLVIVLPGFIFGCGKGKEASKHEGHKEEVKQEATKAGGKKGGLILT